MLRVMMVSTNRWVLPIRLGKALAGAGCLVAAASAKNSLVRKVGCFDAIYDIPAIAPHVQLNAAMEAWRPDLVVPSDDDAAQILCDARSVASPSMLSVIARSQGPAESFAMISSKSRLMQFAEAIGVLVPQTQMLDVSDSRSVLAEQAYPYVIKRDYTCGAQGVVVAKSCGEAIQALHTHQPKLMDTLTRIAQCVKHRTLWPIRPIIFPSPIQYSGQQVVSGRDANRAVFCLHGKVLAGISVEVAYTDARNGPGAVVTFSDNPQMEESARLLVERLGLSGFHGFDFVIENGTEKAYLLEINPRQTPIAHLTTAGGVSLVRAVCESLNCAPRHIASPVLEERIALFPYGLSAAEREGESTKAMYLDVPWDEPALLRRAAFKDGNLVLQRLLSATPNPTTTYGRTHGNTHHADIAHA